MHIPILTMTVVDGSWRDPRGGATLHIPMLTMTVIGATHVEVPPCLIIIPNAFFMVANFAYVGVILTLFAG